MGDQTPRFGLPLLAAGQAQKELFHNEAVTILEALAQPVVETQGGNDPPAAPVAGRSWIVGTAPTGDWAGRGNMLALWTEGGWRFVQPVDGTCAWIDGARLLARYSNGAWTIGEVTASVVTIGGVQVVGPRRPAIPAPVGGAVVDAEARAASAAILATLREHGLIAE